MSSLLQWMRRTTTPGTTASAKTARKNRHRQDHRCQNRHLCQFETLESRALLSSTSLSTIIATPSVSSGGYTAAQITSAYLASNLSINTKLKSTITGDGS